MKPVYVWRYTLRSAKALNAASTRTEHEGALIRDGEGFGCIHPWPELGDLPLEAQLQLLAQGRRDATPLIEGALKCAEVDAAARSRRESIFFNPIPESHWLVREGDDPAYAKSDGFTLAKIKGGRDRKPLIALIDHWSAAGLRIRLDFNESIPAGGFLEFWNELGDERRAVIDQVEDPEEWTRDGWEAIRRAGVPLAVDRDHLNRLRSGDVLVYKPAHHGFACQRDTRFYVTTYMDHAIGLLWAAAFASFAGKRNENSTMLTCGLLTHRCFENDPFFERLRCDGPRLLPPGGTGLGFDDLLESLPWKRLT